LVEPLHHFAGGLLDIPLDGQQTVGGLLAALLGVVVAHHSLHPGDQGAAIVVALPVLVVVLVALRLLLALLLLVVLILVVLVLVVLVLVVVLVGLGPVKMGYCSYTLGPSRLDLLLHLLGLGLVSFGLLGGGPLVSFRLVWRGGLRHFDCGCLLCFVGARPGE
jgi:hypothetical protein